MALDRVKFIKSLLGLKGLKIRRKHPFKVPLDTTDQKKIPRVGHGIFMDNKLSILFYMGIFIKLVAFSKLTGLKRDPVINSQILVSVTRLAPSIR